MLIKKELANVVLSLKTGKITNSKKCKKIDNSCLRPKKIGGKVFVLLKFNLYQYLGDKPQK